MELKRGDTVRLDTKPDGCSSKFYALTVGSKYQIIDFNGSNVITTCDTPGETANYWRGRVTKVSNSPTP